MLTSEAIAGLTADEERLWTRLLLCCDDFGRFDGRPIIVKSRAFPLADLMPGVTVQAVDRWLKALFHKKLIFLYEVQGKPFLAVHRWQQRVRANASKFPPPPDNWDSIADERRPEDGDCPTDDGHPSGKCPTDDSHPLTSASEERGARNEERGSAREQRGTRTPRAAPKVLIPDDFAVSNAVRDWAKRQGYAEGAEAHLEAFRLKAQANAYRYADWDRAFMEAIRADWARVREPRRNGGSVVAHPSSATPDDALMRRISAANGGMAVVRLPDGRLQCGVAYYRPNGQQEVAI